MKKLTNIILALAAMTLHCGCIKEEILPNEGRSGIRVYADLAQTRTEHTSENGYTTVSWVKGDNIYLSTVGGRHDLSYVAESSGPTTDFAASGTELVAEDGDVVYAYYGFGLLATTGSASSFYLKNTREQYYSYGSAFYDELYAKGTVSNNELALHFKHVSAFLKITVPVDKLMMDSSTGNYILKLVSDQSLSAISMMSTIYNIDTSEFSGDSATEVLYFIDEDISGQEYVTVSVAIMPQTYGGIINIYTGKQSECLLRTINVPESGLQAGKVYTLTIGDSDDLPQLTKVQSAYSNVANGINSVTLNLSDGKWYSEVDVNTWQTTYYGKGNYLAVDFYSEDGYLAPGIYSPSAVGGTINPGEYGIGYDPGDMFGIGMYFTDWGTCWWTVDQDAYPQTSAQKITSGDIVVELEGTVYTITVDNGEVKAKFVGEIPEVTRPNVPKEDDYIDEYGINHGQGTEVGGVVWAPVNCGYHAEDYQWGKLYQWGRKYGQGYSGILYDLDRNQLGTSEDLSIPTISYNGATLSEGNDPMNSNIHYLPNIEYGNSDWLYPSDDTLWNVGTESDPVKTEYDPCPDGWRVPTSSELIALTSCDYVCTLNDLEQGGFLFMGTDDNHIFLPAAGGRNGSSGTVSFRGFNGYYWSSTANGAFSAGMLFAKANGYIHNDYARYRGFSVRCVQE